MRGGSSAQTKVAFSAGHATPVNVSVIDLIDEVDDAIDRAANLLIHDLIRQPLQQFVIWTHGKRQAVDLDGVHRALEVGKVWKKANGVIGMSQPWQQRLAKCPKCNTRSLGNFANSNTITCSVCGGSMTRSEYERICLIMSNRKESN